MPGRTYRPPVMPHSGKPAPGRSQGADSLGPPTSRGHGAAQSPVTLHTSVPSILATFRSQLESVRAPLYIFVAEVMLLVLYFVTMIRKNFQ